MQQAMPCGGLKRPCQDPPEHIHGKGRGGAVRGSDVVLMQRRSQAGRSVMQRLSAQLVLSTAELQPAVPTFPVDTGEFSA